MLGAIPADHRHAHALADAGDFAADAAKSDYAQRLAEQLHALVGRPYAGAHLTIHPREITRAGPQQRDGVLGDRGIAIAFDDVYLDAARIELAYIHVARRARSEKDDVPEFGALRHQRRWHVGVIVDRYHVAAYDARQVVACKSLAIDVDRRIIGPDGSFPHRRQPVVAVDKNGFHDCLDRSGTFTSHTRRR